MTLPPVANRLRLLLLWAQRRRRRAGVAHAGGPRLNRDSLDVTTSPTCNSQGWSRMCKVVQQLSGNPD
jgi:hypothetical protein